MSSRIPGILLILFTIVSSGCMKKKHITGDEFVPHEVLVDVIVDIHLVDGITNDRKFYRRYADADSIDLLSPIFDKYQITHEQFDATMTEYSKHPLLLDQVYKDVLMKLNVMLDENENEAEPNIPAG